MKCSRRKIKLASDPKLRLKAPVLKNKTVGHTVRGGMSIIVIYLKNEEKTFLYARHLFEIKKMPLIVYKRPTLTLDILREHYFRYRK